MKTKYILLIINHSIPGMSRRDPQIYPLPNPAGRTVQAPRRQRQDWCVRRDGPPSSPTCGQPGSLFAEHLVAEVVGLGFEVVFSGRSLVAHDEKGSWPRHQGKGSHQHEAQVTGSQARLCSWRFSCRDETGAGGWSAQSSSAWSQRGPGIAPGRRARDGTRPHWSKLSRIRRSACPCPRPEPGRARQPGQVCLPTVWIITGQEEGGHAGAPDLQVGAKRSECPAQRHTVPTHCTAPGSWPSPHSGTGKHRRAWTPDC